MNIQDKLADMLPAMKSLKIRFHFSWYLAFGLISWSLSTSYYPNYSPQLTSTGIILISMISAILVLLSILLHEMAHTITAIYYKIPVKEIIFHLFGGVAKLDHEPSTAKSDFLVAAAGPVTSLVLAVFFQVIAKDPLSLYISATNYLVFFFNLVPAFPLDGGRIIRSIAWWHTNSYLRGTELATRIGVWFTALIILGGISLVFTGRTINGVSLIVIGTFLKMTGRGVLKQVKSNQLLKGKASDLLFPIGNTVKLNSTMNYKEFIEKYMVIYGYVGYIVYEGDKIAGYITYSDKYNREMEHLSLGDIMIPLSSQNTICHDMGLREAYEQMLLTNNDKLFVFKDDEMIGLVGRYSISRKLDMLDAREYKTSAT